MERDCLSVHIGGMEPSAGNLETILFLFSLAVTFGLEAMKTETTPRRTSFWFLAAVCFLTALGWTYIKPLWPPITGAITSISVNPAAWFVVAMFFLGAFAFHRPKERAKVLTAPGTNRLSKRRKTRRGNLPMSASIFF